MRSHRKAAAQEGREIDSARPRVLLVEDDLDLADVLERALDREGYVVHHCCDGEAAVQDVLSWRPDITILDIGHTEPDGRAVARELRQRSMAQIIMLSGHNTVDERAQALDFGADEFLAKPFELFELFTCLRRLPIDLQLAGSRS